MKKIIGIIIFTLCFVPFVSSLALHDDESIGKGGAWKSNDVKTDPANSSDSENSIDMKFDKAFKQSPIIIPSKKQKSEKSDTVSTEREDPMVPFPHPD